MYEFERCPRCGDRSFERLVTYSHCCQCLYFEDYWSSPESDVVNATKAIEHIERLESEEDFDLPEIAKIEPAKKMGA